MTQRGPGALGFLQKMRVHAWRHPVIAVRETDKVTAARAYTNPSRAVDPNVVRKVLDPDAVVPSGKFAENAKGAISRGVIDHNDFDVSARLSE